MEKKPSDAVKVLKGIMWGATIVGLIGAVLLFVRLHFLQMPQGSSDIGQIIFYFIDIFIYVAAAFAGTVIGFIMGAVTLVVRLVEADNSSVRQPVYAMVLCAAAASIAVLAFTTL